MSIEIQEVNNEHVEQTRLRHAITWTVIDARGNEHTGLTHKNQHYQSPKCSFRDPDGHIVEFYGNFQIFQE